MAMTIGTNPAAMTAARSLHESGKLMQTSMERLSTGSRINSAADDAAGLALANNFEAQSKSMAVAVKNINNGVALTGAIEASLDEVGDILVRMQELAVQSASDSYSGADRQMMHDEVVALRNELTALSTRIEFGGQKILDGTYSGKQIQVGDSAGETIVITQGSVAAASIGGNRVVGTAQSSELEATGDDAVDDIATDGHDFEITYTNSSGTAVTTTSNYGTTHTDSAATAAAAVNLETGTHGVQATAFTAAMLTMVADASGTGGNNNMNISLGATESTLIAISEAATVATMVAAINDKAAQTGITARDSGVANKIILESVTGSDIIVKNSNDGTTDKSDVKVQQYSTGAETGTLDTTTDQTAGAGTDTVAVRGIVTLTSAKAFSVTGSGADSYVAPSTTTASSLTAVSTADLTTQANAKAAIASFSAAISSVASMKADLGALNNRLGHALDSAIMLRDMTNQAAATITDTDYSQESANLARAQVQQQVGTAMLAQANAAPQLVLQLIQ